MAHKNQRIEKVRHSLAHLLAMAVLEMRPDAQLGVGPTIENGFYYDFLLSKPLGDDNLRELEQRVRKLISQNLPYEKLSWSLEKANSYFKNQPFKLELIKEKTQGDRVQIYKTGSFHDFCKGGHVSKSSEIPADAFKLTHVAGAYWKGDEKRPMLTRIYGVAFSSKKQLDEYLDIQAQAKARDHKKVGVALDLFSFSPLVGGGLPLWTPRGTLIRNLLDDFVWQLRKTRGYQKVEIPHLARKELYQTSGHWDKFKDELFKIKTREGHQFVVKPMNCPHHVQIYARKPHSYRELPQRYANTTMVYRDEQTGELAGLTRVRSITQDDAHVFCRYSQIKEEFMKIWDIVDEFYAGCGFTELKVRLSLHDSNQPDKYLGGQKKWQEAEDMLRSLTKERKVKEVAEAIGEAAFYGPKVDFIAQDSLNRQWQLATIQLDMNMPERFNLFCVNEKGERERIVMIHAAIMGAIERFLAILIEHHAGFPLWLAPVQVAVLPISDEVLTYAKEIQTALVRAGVRAELNDKQETLNKKVREAQMQKIPYIAVVGKQEQKSGKVSVRERKTDKQTLFKIEEFIKKLESQISSKQ